MKNNKLLLRSLILIALAVSGNCVLPVRIRGESGDNICSNVARSEAQLNLIKEEVKRAIMNTVNPTLDKNENFIACGHSGWRRVVYLNMTSPSATCPSSWTTHRSPRGCGRTAPHAYTCDSAIFPIGGVSYSSVCGRILAYQRGTTDAFFNSVRGGQASIDSPYVDGISVTHGPVGSRQHIWSFAAAIYEEDRSYQTSWNCACTNTQYNWPYQLPSFIQNNYFCDTGNPGPGLSLTSYYTADPLWDGAGCGPNNACCQFSNPPWFKSTLPQRTSDDIELRLCHGEVSSDEDTIVYLIEIYIQ